MKPCVFCGKPTHQVYGNAIHQFPCCAACHDEATTQTLHDKLREVTDAAKR